MAAGEIAKLFVSIGANLSEFTKGTKQVQKDMEGLAGYVKKHTLAIGGALAGVGAAGLKLASDARKLNADLSQTGMTMGISTSKMRDLTLATANVSFNLKEVAATFDILARAGVRNTQELTNAANAFDALADATGGEAATMAEQLIPVFRAFGMELPTTSAEMDKFTWLVKNTTVDLSDFATVVQRLAPDMQKVGLTTEDAMAALAILNSRGITGRAAIQQLDTALQAIVDSAGDAADAQMALADATKDLADIQEEAAGIFAESDIALQRNSWRIDDLNESLKNTELTERERQETLLDIQEAELDRENILKRVKDTQDKVKASQDKLTEATNQAQTSEISLSEILGTTQSELDSYKEKMAGATGLTDEYAKAANSQFGIMEKLKQQWSEITFQMGGFLKPLEPLMTGIMSLGMLIIGLNGILAAFGITMATVLWPITLVVLGIAAIIAAGVLLWAFWDEITGFFKEWGLLILGFLFPVAAVPLAIMKWKDEILSVLKTVWDAIVNITKAPMNAIIGLFNKMMGFVSGMEIINLPKISIAGVTVFPGFSLNLPTLPTIPSLQYGGIVPGAAGEPVPIIAHGGERYMGMGNPLPAGVGGWSVNVTIKAGAFMGSQADALDFGYKVRDIISTINKRDGLNG